MDKEIMAKINETLKANGKRELSMDELDLVCGGWREDQLTSEESVIWNALLDEWREAMSGTDEAIRMAVEKIAEFGKQMKAKYEK